MKKKVLFITRKYPPQTGGMENLCFHVAENLPDDEFEIKVVALGRRQIHLVWFFPYTLFYTIFQARKYNFLLLGDGLMCMCGTLCKVFARRTKRVIILHGLDVTYRNPIYQLYLKIFLNKSSDLFICDSRNTQKIAKQWGVVIPTTVITPGIDIDTFTGSDTIGREEFCKKYQIPEENLILITVGRLIRRKGVNWFVEYVMPRLNGVTYLIIGEGEERAQIQETIVKYDLNENVKLLGRLSDADWKNCYVNADIFVMPNIHVEDDVEGFGIVAVEASMAGLIVVASDIDGIPDAIQNGENGILVKGGDKEIWYDTISKIQKNISTEKNSIPNYINYSRKHFAWSNICELYRSEMKKI